MTRTIELEVSPLLPDIPSETDHCIARLQSLLSSRIGVHEVTILPGEKDASARLAISYDADRLTVARIKELAHVAGAEISERYGHVVWQADGINSTRRAQTVADLLASKPGILEANADASGRFIAEYDRQLTDEPRIAGELKNLGVSVLAGDVARNAEHSSKDHDHDDEDRAGHSHGGIFGANTELYFSLASGVFLATGFGIEKLWSGHPGWLPFACYLAAYFFGGILYRPRGVGQFAPAPV